MSVTTDILRSYHAPRQVLRERLSRGPREDRALVFLMLACGLIFVAQWPRLAREAHLTEGLELNDLLAGAVMGLIFIAPLALYALAALSHLAARAMGGQGTWYSARLALFWALLAAAPLWLLWGLVAGFVGDGVALDIVGLIALGAFLVIWIAGLREAES